MSEIINNSKERIEALKKIKDEKILTDKWIKKKYNLPSWLPISNQTNDKLLGVWVSDDFSVDLQNDRAAIRLESQLRMIVTHYASQGMVTEDYAIKLYAVIIEREFRVVPNKMDNNGGHFIMFDESPAPGEGAWSKGP